MRSAEFEIVLEATTLTGPLGLVRHQENAATQLGENERSLRLYPAWSDAGPDVRDSALGIDARLGDAPI